MPKQPEVRVAKNVRVKVRGRDASGNPFIQTATTVNVSRHGARLLGVPRLLGPGEIIELGRWWKRAKYRVVWMGQPGTAEADQVGICCSNGESNIWGMEFQEPPAGAAYERPAPAAAPPPPDRPQSAAEPEPDAPAGTLRHFSVRLRCPYGDEDIWVDLPNRRETLHQIQNINWDMDCPTHGPQHELPIDVHEKSASAAPAPAPRVERSEFKVARKDTRLGVRVPKKVPLLVQGTVEGREFLEEASSIVVNANGGLIDVAAPVQVGQRLQLVNRKTQKSESCRVAFVAPGAEGHLQVGIAFRYPADYFWEVR